MYLDSNIKLKCWNSQHLGWVCGLTLPLMIIILIILPMYCYKKMSLLGSKDKNEEVEKEKEEVKKRFAIMLRGFKLKRFYWEMLISFRKTCF